MPKRAPANPDKFDEASKWFRGRTPVTKAEWELMSNQARRQSFTIAGTQQLKVVQTVFDELQKAIDKGTPIDAWRKALKKKLKGDFAEKNAHNLTTAFINANQTAYNTGRYYQLSDPEVTAVMPLWFFDAVLDDRTCFAAGTPVRMADGSQRAIESVNAGETVVSCRGFARVVTATLVTPKRVWGDITLTDGRSVRVTPNHPFLTTHGWIAAKLLRPGDALVVEENQLQSLWEGVREAGQRVPARLLKRLCKRAEQKVQKAPLQSVRRPVRVSSRDVASLQRSLQGGAAEACDLQNLQESVPALTGEQAVLQRRMQSHNEDLRMAPGPVRVPAHLRQTRPVQILLGRLQRRSAPPRIAEDSYSKNVRALHGDVPNTPGIEAAQAVLAKVPDATSTELHSMREESAAHQSAVLLSELLPEAYRGDWSGAWSARGAHVERGGVRARSEDRPMVDRLPGGQQDLSGSGRGVLASTSESPRARPETRQATDRQGLLSGAYRREGVQRGPRVRDARALDIWPVPGNKVEEAAAAVVARVDWQLTESAEPAYDLQVDADSGFIANGLVVHNSTICLECAGTIRRFDDPWWLTHWCPLHHVCRSAVRALTEAMAKRKGGVTETLPRPVIKGDFGLAPPLRAGQIWEPKREDFDPSAWTLYQRNQGRMKAANDNAQTEPQVPKRTGPGSEAAIEFTAGAPDQPRVPPGNPTGGQWTKGFGYVAPSRKEIDENIGKLRDAAGDYSQGRKPFDASQLVSDKILAGAEVAAGKVTPPPKVAKIVKHNSVASEAKISKWSSSWVGNTTTSRAEDAASSLAKPGSWAQHQYASTQAVVSFNAAKLRADGVMDEHGYLTLYRGVKGGQAEHVKSAFARPEAVYIGVRPLTSWSSSKDVAGEFAGHDGAVLTQKIHSSRVFASHLGQSGRWNAWGEKEFAVLHPEGEVRVEMAKP